MNDAIDEYFYLETKFKFKTPLTMDSILNLVEALRTACLDSGVDLEKLTVPRISASAADHFQFSYDQIKILPS